MRTFSYMLLFALILALSACGGREVPSAETVEELADALRAAGLGHGATRSPSSTDLTNFQAIEGLVLEGRDLLVEIYLFDSEGKLQLARTAATTDSGTGSRRNGEEVGVLRWGLFLLLIREEPSGGHVRRTLETVIRGN